MQKKPRPLNNISLRPKECGDSQRRDAVGCVSPLQLSKGRTEAPFISYLICSVYGVCGIPDIKRSFTD